MGASGGMNIQIDINGTIDYAPAFFSWFTKALIKSGHKVFIATTEPDSPENRAEAVELLRKQRLQYTKLVMGYPLGKIPSAALPRGFPRSDILYAAKLICAKKNHIDILFDDDPYVLKLFHKHLPKIRTLKAGA